MQIQATKSLKFSGKVFLILMATYCVHINLGFTQCFSFEKPISKVLRPPAEVFENQGSGKTSGGFDYGYSTDHVDRPIADVLHLLYDHNTTKSDSVKEMKVSESHLIPDQKNHRVELTVKAALFFTVSWTETWAYTLRAGSWEKPKEVLISYEKVEGTTHIKHLCGSMLLTETGPSKTKLYQYEEVKATQRDADDTLKGLNGTVETLRRKVL